MSSTGRCEYLPERTLPIESALAPCILHEGFFVAVGPIGTGLARVPVLKAVTHSAEGLNRHDETHARDPRPLRPASPPATEPASDADSPPPPARCRPGRNGGRDRPGAGSGAGSLVRSLESLGVEVVFGIPGGAILPAYDPLYDSTVRHILVRHEQGAGHAATGYAQATGKVGVCMATSGPGATNLVTPIADAYMDSVPMVAITGQVRAALDRHGRLPGGGHPGHHAADHQAQLPGADGRGDPAGHGRGVPPGLDRPSRPGAGRHPQGRAAGADHLLLAAHARPARLPADAAPARQADPRGGPADRPRPAGRCSTSAAACSRPAPPRAAKLAELTGGRWSPR